jgi:site-specific recombinase XerD
MENNNQKIRNFFFKIGLSEQTVKRYMYSIDNFLLVNPDAAKYKYKDILLYIALKVKQKQNSNAEITMLAGIKRYYDYLIDCGIRNDHPCKTLFLKHKNHDILQQDLFTTRELELLLGREERYSQLKNRNLALISFLIFQGLSAGEITKIKVQHIDFDQGLIFAKGTRKLTMRHLEVNERQFSMLENYIFGTRKELLRTKTDILLLGKLGSPITIDDINYLVSTFKPLFPDRNLNPKTIRLSVISNWLNEKRIPLEQAQLMAGHKTISVTQRYRYAPIEEQRTLINRFYPFS